MCSLRVTPLSGPVFAVVAFERVVRSQVEYPDSNFSKELENWEFACGWDELKLQPGVHSREWALPSSRNSGTFCPKLSETEEGNVLTPSLHSGMFSNQGVSPWQAQAVCCGCYLLVVVKVKFRKQQKPVDYFSHFTTVVLIHMKTFFAVEVSVKSIACEITRIFAPFFWAHRRMYEIHLLVQNKYSTTLMPYHLSFL